MRVRNNGSLAAEIPAKPLADEAPLYSREAKAPSHGAAHRTQRNSEKHPFPTILRGRSDLVRDSLRQLLRDPTIASKNWVYRQYDHMVRTGTVVWPGSDAAVFRVREANKILAATTDCNSLYCRLDPREGGTHRGRGSGAQSHLLGRNAARRDRQSEFRQSLQAGKFLAVARSGGRRRGNVPRFRHAGHRRQCLSI